MCGIFGLIGETHPEEHQSVFALLSTLFVATMQRGQHASGYAGIDQNGRVVMAKAPLAADKFIATPGWTRFSQDPIPSMFIGHCRWATTGSPEKNQNNHPFVTEDGRFALVHNGVICGHHEVARSEHVPLKTECDSEVILRVIEAKHEAMAGIKAVFNNVFSFFSRDGACALLDSEKKAVFLFRSSSKPCYVVRVAQLRNAVAFASTEDILRFGLEAVFGKDSMGRGFELKPNRAYEITMTPTEPKIETTDIEVKVPKTTDYFSGRLTVPTRVEGTKRRYRVTSDDTRQGSLFEPIGFSEVPSTSPEECRCPCGGTEWVWPSEVKKCKTCGKFYLRPGQPPYSIDRARPQEKNVDSDDDAWITLYCETCGLSWQQHSIHLAKCIKCGSTFVTITAARSATGKKDIETGIWKCEKCGVRLISTGKPLGHSNCMGKEFTWEGSLKAGAWDTIKKGKRCHDCYKSLPENWSGSRCQPCYEKRKAARDMKRAKVREYPMRCLRCGQRYKVDEVPEACKCGGKSFRKDW